MPRTRWSARPARLLVPLALIAGSLVQVASAGHRPAKIVGSSCAQGYELSFRSGAGGIVENHALDSTWVHLQVTPTDLSPTSRQYVMRWSLSPDVELCPSTAKFGHHAERVLAGAGGTQTAVIGPGAPVRIFVRARARTAARPRALSRAAIKALVTGWAERACALDGSDAPAAALLHSLAGRGHAHGCKGPGGSRAVAPAVLLHHVSAYFNHAGSGPVPAAGAAPTAHEAMAREYYRVLAQLTTGSPVP